jgi:hypothetical protein
VNPQVSSMTPPKVRDREPTRVPVVEGGASVRHRVDATVRVLDWRSGTAHILDDDDPEDRQRILSQANLARRLCISTSKAVNTNPLTIRVELDSE